MGVGYGLGQTENFEHTQNVLLSIGNWADTMYSRTCNVVAARTWWTEWEPAEERAWGAENRRGMCGDEVFVGRCLDGTLIFIFLFISIHLYKSICLCIYTYSRII